MRTLVAALAGLVALSAVSIQAAPLPPSKATSSELGATPSIELVRDGCGYRYYRTRWQDQWGYWHWGRCVPKWRGGGAFQQQRGW
jgi:hypothetical protein